METALQELSEKIPPDGMELNELFVQLSESTRRKFTPLRRQGRVVIDWQADGRGIVRLGVVA